jgi:hypothetical protein
MGGQRKEDRRDNASCHWFNAAKSRFPAQIDGALDKALDDVNPEPPDASEAGVIWSRLGEGSAPVPAMGEAESRRLDQLPFGADLRRVVTGGAG